MSWDERTFMKYHEMTVLVKQQVAAYPKDAPFSEFLLNFSGQLNFFCVFSRVSQMKRGLNGSL